MLGIRVPESKHALCYPSKVSARCCPLCAAHCNKCRHEEISTKACTAQGLQRLCGCSWHLSLCPRPCFLGSRCSGSEPQELREQSAAGSGTSGCSLLCHHLAFGPMGEAGQGCNATHTADRALSHLVGISCSSPAL